jgi:hypothetical protein
MLTLEQRAELVIAEAWRRLPPIKRQASIAEIVLEDLGAKHGSFNPDTGVLTLSTRLFEGDNAAQLMMIDCDGNAPPLREECVSRCLHTATHELFHAIGTTTRLDSTDEWLRLSGWIRRSDNPLGTDRYWESRVGWEQGPSEWRHRVGCWWTRDYARRSPFEDFADCCTHIALGWSRFFEVSANGRAKLSYLRREVWGEKGTQAIAAARQRWQKRLAEANY